MKEADVHGRAEEALRSCLGEVPFLTIESLRPAPAGEEGGEPDFIAELGDAGERSRLVVEAKANGQPHFARSAAQQLRRYLGDEEYGVLIAPYVSERSASILSEEGIGFVDLAGNCHLCFNRLYVRREGRENPFSESRELKSLLPRRPAACFARF